jgi:predicted cupin superfamily sugar epimerase/quercetin dioxygenase-like cupin family protein
MKTAMALAGALLLGCGPFTAMASPAPDTGIPAGAQALIRHFHMENIPHEGPWFIQTFKSQDEIGGPLAERYASPRRAYTATYLLLTQRDFSAMHRLATDEMWHFYGGSPARLLLLYPDGHGETKVWGSNILAGEEPQILVPRGTWMGAIPLGKPQTAYSFGGNTLSPGFEYADYEGGNRQDLVARYPKFARMITQLTRPSAPAKPAPAPSPLKLEELVGRTAPQKSDRISAARFTMAAGTTMPSMMTKEGHEVMFVTSGEGTVQIGDAVQPLKPGAVVYLPPQVPHRIRAVSQLTFYVSATPAWQPSDTVILKP